MKRLIATLIVLSLLAGCAGLKTSKLNPFNWFGRAQAAQRVAIADTPADPRPLVAQVLDLSVEPYPGGAIIRATGLPPTQGYWNAELVALPLDAAGVLVYEFRIFPPPVAKPVRSPVSREVTVAADLSSVELVGVTRIVVQGSANALSSSR